LCSLITLIGIQFPVRAVAWAVVHCVASAFSELTMLERADPEFPGVPVYIWELEGFSADTVNGTLSIRMHGLLHFVDVVAGCKR
jgi:hypothetical protein